MTTALSGGTNAERTYDKNELKMVEKKMGKKLAESITELGEIIKEYANKYKKLNDRMISVEYKVFGASKADHMPPTNSGLKKVSSFNRQNSN